MSAAPTKPPRNLTGYTVNGVRPGQRRPFRKSTNAEMQRRIEWLALKISIQPNLHEGDLRALCRAEYGVHWLTAKEYIIRAKALIQDRAKITREQAKCIGVNALLDMIQNETGAQRVAALRLWVDVFGLAAHTQMRVGDPQGNSIKPAVAPVVHFVFPNSGRNEVATNGHAAQNLCVK